jgi:uncharacterized tellurite resistance protein B-like protein
MSYQSLAEKNSLVSHLIEIARADGLVNMSEISYIFWTAQQLQLSHQELKSLFEKPARPVAPITLRDRVEAFHKCLTLMTMDNDVSIGEISTCHKIASELKLDKTKTENLLQLIPNKEGDLISVDEMKTHYGVQY